MHKITRFLHLFKNYIIDTSESKDKTFLLTTSFQNKYINFNDNNFGTLRKKIIEKPKFAKKISNKSKIHWEENIMVNGSNNTVKPYDDVPKKYVGGGDTQNCGSNNGTVNGNETKDMSLKYSIDGETLTDKNNFKDVNYYQLTQKSVNNDLIGKNKKSTSFIKNILSLKMLSLIIFVFLGTLSVCTLRYVRFRSTETMYIASVGLIIGEIFKLILSIIFLTYELKSPTKAAKALYVGTFIHWKDTLNAGIPAFLYAIQNLLFQYAISYLDATVLLVTQQLKILTTALFAVTILKSKLSGIQWLSMVVLIMGIILIQWKIPGDKKDNNHIVNNTTHIHNEAKEVHYPLGNPLNIPPQIIGLLMVFIGTVLSGFSGIFLEKIFKKTSQSIWCLNFQLAFFSVPIFIGVSFVTDNQIIEEKGMFAGFDWWVVLVYFIYGLHGMVVALLLKHASSILKCFASGFIIAATAIVSIFLFDILPNLLLVIGTSIILFAVYLYSSFPYKKKDVVVLSQRCEDAPNNA